MIRSALMTVMTNAAIKAGRGLKRDFGEVEQLQVSLKGPGDFVSLADKRAEKTIYEELSRARPGYGFVMEEGGRVEGADKSHTWHIDPLDATTNFLHAIPIFAISIALEREGQIVAGVVYNPATDETYVSEKGQGAFGGDAPDAGGRATRVVAGADRLRHAASRQGRQHPRFRADLEAVMTRVVNVRRLGCASLDLCLCRQRPVRRILGARPPLLGHRRRLADRPEAGGFVTTAKARRISSPPARSAAATSSSIATCWPCCAPPLEPRSGPKSGLDANPARHASICGPEIRSWAR